MCKKMIEENPSVAFAVQPQSNIDGNLIQEIGEAGGEIFEVYSSPMPEKPQEPKPADYQSDADYTEAVEEFEIDSEMYQGEMEIIEEKIASGEYHKVIDISCGFPQIGNLHNLTNKTMIIDNICNSCSCTPVEAQQHLDSEIRNLRDLQKVNDLRYNDFEEACKSLGLDYDYVAYFITALAA